MTEPLPCTCTSNEQITNCLKECNLKFSDPPPAQLSSNERLTSEPTAEEYAMLREAYAETYPVRPLLNAIERLERELAEAHDILLLRQSLPAI